MASSCEFIKTATRCTLPPSGSKGSINILCEDQLPIEISRIAFKKLIKENAYNPSLNTFYAERGAEGWLHVIIANTATNSVCFKASAIATRGLTVSEKESLAEAYITKRCLLS